MRIAIDFRVMSTEAANRGMGRYTQQQLREVLRRDTTNEYFILTYPGIRKTLIDPEVSSSSRVQFLFIDLNEINNDGLSLNREKVYEYSGKFQEILYKKKIDLYHATTPFLNPIITDFAVCPYLCTLYDLIPYIYPQEYFGSNFELAIDYALALKFLQASQRLISISLATKQDAYFLLGYPKDRNQVAYPIVEPCFRVLSPEDCSKNMSSLRNKYRIPSQFILSITGIHHSKNARTLLNAYNSLPESLKKELPLLMVFPSEYANQAFINIYGNPDNVIYTNSVIDEELVALYNSATMVVHPSRYEGFGYPVAEALKCGAPVITTTTSSLPEISGDAAILVNPECVDQMTEAIEALYANPDKRKEMSLAGPKSVERFNLDQLGNVTLDSYQKLFSEIATTVPSRLRRVAIWSSFPPLNCGVADYTEELVEALSGYCEIEVFVDHGYLPDDSSYPRYQIHDHAAFEWRNKQKPFDIVIYQMGSTFFQKFMYDQIEKYPGIVVIHDLIMGLGFFSIYASSKELYIFRNRILKPEGKEAARTFEAIIKKSKEYPIVKLQEMFKNFYMLRWITNNSLALIVHSNHVKGVIKENYSETNVHVVDMGVKDPWKGRVNPNTAVLKLKMGISPSTFVVGIFGSVVEVKRITSCLQAIRKVVDIDDDVLLLVVGSHPSPAYVQLLQNMSRELHIERNVRFTGRTSFGEFENYFLLSDMVLNLRYPTFKGMSAILIRALAAGKPIVITDVPEWAGFPDDFCLRVAPDQNEVDEMAEYIIRLISNPSLLRMSSRKARSFFLQRGTTRHMAEQYMQIIEMVLANSQTHRNG